MVRTTTVVVVVLPAQRDGLVQVLQHIFAGVDGQSEFLYPIHVTHGTHRITRIIAALPAPGQEECPRVARPWGLCVHSRSAAPDLARGTVVTVTGRQIIPLTGMAVAMIQFHAVGVAELAKALVVIVVVALANRQVLTNVRTIEG